jgi:hypothetical protein
VSARASERYRSDRLWPDYSDLAAELVTDRDAAVACVRALVDACAGNLSAMGRAVGREGRSARRMAAWRLLARAGLLGYRVEVQRAAQAHGQRTRLMGRAWHLRAYSARFAAEP